MNLLIKKPWDSFFRVGIDRSKKSFLLSVALALNLPNLTTKERRANFVKSTLLKISQNEGLLACSRQENPNKSTEEIGNMINNPETYLSPRFFYRILEEFFQCKIFFFTGDTLGIPNHQKNYLTSSLSDDKPVVLVLEHLGSESDLLKTDMYPQCELIAVGNKSLKTASKTTFNASDIVNTIQVIFDRMTKSFFKGKLTSFFNNNNNNNSSIDGQLINTFGKTIGFVLSNSVFVYLPEPIAPIDKKEITVDKITRKSFTEILKIFPSEQGYKVSKCVFKNSTHVHTLEIKREDKVLFFVPIIPSPKSEVLLPSVVSKVFIPDPKVLSGFEVFSVNEKLTWYISQYILYLFSLHLHESKPEVVNEDFIKSFLNTHTIVDDERIASIGRLMLNNQNPFEKNFDLSSSNPLMKNSRKMAIPKNTRAKLDYMLKLRLNTNLEEVADFHNRASLDTYIKDIYDFQINPGQVLLANISSLLKYIQEFDRSFVVSHKIKLSYDDDEHRTEPYLFRNTLVSPDVYFANNYRDRTEALIALNNWQTYGVNNTEDFSLPLDENYISVYGYVNEHDIKLLDGDEDADDVALLGYKLKQNGPVEYTTLLNYKS